MLDIELQHQYLLAPDFLNYIFAPLFENRKAALAVSGGPDSMALMHLAARFAAQQDQDIELVVLTVDHGLREEAAEEVKLVAREAKALGLECHILKPEAFAPTSRIQESARDLRYHLMKHKMDELGLSQLLTAHHMDDQSETFFMRLARGSGLAGLGAMSRNSVGYGVDILRPFLDLPKSDLMSFVYAEELLVVADPSNQDDKFERVRWRQALKGLRRLGLQAKNIGVSTRRLRRAEVALALIAENVYGERFFYRSFRVRFVRPVHDLIRTGGNWHSFTCAGNRRCGRCRVGPRFSKNRSAVRFALYGAIAASRANVGRMRLARTRRNYSCFS